MSHVMRDVGLAKDSQPQLAADELIGELVGMIAAVCDRSQQFAMPTPRAPASLRSRQAAI
jgi:hypothetical protein